MLSKVFRKGMAVALSVAMVTGLAPTNVWQPVIGSPITVVHAEDTGDTGQITSVSTMAQISINYQEEKLFVSKKSGEMTKGDIFYYQLVNDDRNGKQVAPDATKWNVAEVDNLTEIDAGDSAGKAQCMDMSWVSTSKGQTLYVTFDTDPSVEEPASLHIPAQVTKLKIDFTGIRPAQGTENDTYIGNDVTGYLVLDKSKTDSTVTSFKDLEWRSTNRAWNSVIQEDTLTIDFLCYMRKGENLEFRKKPTADSPAGKAVKVKVPAKPNAPKITADTVKQTVALPAGSEYIKASDYKDGKNEWTAVAAKATKYFDELFDYNGTKDVTILVRSKSTSKKVASKITEVTLKAAEETSEDTVVVDLNGTAATDGKLTVTYTDIQHIEKGLTITNNTQKKYQVAIVKKTELESKNIDFAKGSSLKIGDRSNAAFVFKDINVKGKVKVTTVGSKWAAKWNEEIKTEADLKNYQLLVRTRSGLAPGKIVKVDLEVKKETEEITPEPASEGTSGEGENEDTSEKTEDKDNQTNPFKLVWNYEDCSVKVPFGANKTIYYQFATAEKEPKQWENIYQQDIKDAGAEGDYAVIDLSALNPAKDNWLYLKGDTDTNAVFVKCEKNAVLKATYKASSVSLTESQKKFCENYGCSDETGYYIFQADKTEVTDSASVYWKTENGLWSPITTLDLHLYKYKGVKLYFRLQTANKLYSKPISVKYAGKAKASAVKVDGDKLTVSLTNKMEYKVKMRDGAYSEWLKPDTGTRSSAKVKLSDLSGMTGNGDGIRTQWKDTILMVRTAGTDKKISSNVGMIRLYAPEVPICGSGTEGMYVEPVDVSKPESGMKFTNNSKLDYQIAMIDGGSNVDGVMKAIDLTATSKQDGYIKFTIVKAGKEAKYPYNNYKNFTNPVAVCRIATIKENTKTPEMEYRIASVIELVTAGTPQCNLSSGIVKIEGENDSVTQSVNFSISDGWTVYYSADGTMPTVSEEGQVTGGTPYANPFDVTVGNGKTVTIQAMGVKLDSSGKVEKIGGKITIPLTGYKAGDNSVYKERWGYQLCLEEDKVNGNTIGSSLYTMLYDGIVEQQKEIDVTALSIPVSKANVDFVSLVSERIRYDNPQLLQYGGKWKYSSGNGKICKFMPEYNQDAETTKKMMSEVEETYQAIEKLALEYGNTTNLAEVSDVVKLKAIHDYLVLHNVYNYSAYDQNIYGAMSPNNSKASPVCMSYAMSTVYCCQRMGIECVLVIGDVRGRGLHAWNLIRLDNGDDKDDSDDWYEMDVTWDDPTGGDPDKIYTDYFNITTDQISQKYKRIRSTKAYTKYPVEKATGTLYSAEKVYGYASAISYEEGSDLLHYGCGLELPEIAE